MIHQIFLSRQDRQELHWYKDAILKKTCKTEKGPGNGTGISQIPFQMEKVDCLWRLSTISEQNRVFWLNGKHPLCHYS